MRNALTLVIIAMLAVLFVPASAADMPEISLSIAQEGATGGLPVSVVFTTS